MTVSLINFHLVDGFIHNWLVAGPQVLLVEDPAGAAGIDLRQEVARQYFQPELQITEQPVVRGKLSEGIFTIEDYRGSWEYYGCLEDHLVNHSGSYPSARYLRSWAYTQLNSPKERWVQFHLTTPGPADIWVNREHLLRKDAYSAAWPTPEVVSVRLNPGQNQVFVRFENLAMGDCAHFMALQVCSQDGVPFTEQTGLPCSEIVSINLPTTILPRLLELREHLERLFAEVALEHDVFERDHEIAFYLPNAPYAEEIVTVRVMDSANIILRDGAIEVRRGQRIPLNYAYELIAGRYQIELLPRVYEYYELNLRIKRDIPFWTVGNAPCSTERYGTYQERCQEGFLKAAEQWNNLFGDIARMALNRWGRVEVKHILGVVDRINQQVETSRLQLAGLLDLLYRFGDHPNFPAEIRPALEDCLQHHDYAIEAGGHGAEALLACTCELLAGQRFPEQVFPRSGQTGHQHAQRGTRLAQAWLLDRAKAGFEDWGSGEELAHGLIALSLLVDLVEDNTLQELAVVVMDKIFFALAVNSYRGILGAPQRRVTPLDLKGGLLQPTTGIARLMWGQGVFNHRIEGFVSLACMQQYELPEMIAAIATNLPGEMWAREQHAAGYPANKVAYRTPDYLLSSVQDQLPGRRGAREHLWQATFGPAAIVYVTNPGCSFEESAMAPGYWIGNATLPRVAQWKNALIAIYNLPEQDWMGFTHAYFPVRAFDEHHLQGNWAFARKGNGYLALTCSQGIALTVQGPQAFKEMRAAGRQVIWVCHLGRAASDGDFTAFQEKILALPLQFDRLSLVFTTLMGEQLSFGYIGPFTVNGEEITLSGYPHYENPYTSTQLNSEQMDIVYGDTLLRLDFSIPKGSSPRSG